MLQETSATLDKVEKLIWALQDGERCKIVILLMVQKSEKNNLGCKERTFVNNRLNYQPLLVRRISASSTVAHDLAHYSFYPNFVFFCRFRSEMFFLGDDQIVKPARFKGFSYSYHQNQAIHVGKYTVYMDDMGMLFFPISHDRYPSRVTSKGWNFKPTGPTSRAGNGSIQEQRPRES